MIEAETAAAASCLLTEEGCSDSDNDTDDQEGQVPVPLCLSMLWTSLEVLLDYLNHFNNIDTDLAECSASRDAPVFS